MFFDEKSASALPAQFSDLADTLDALACDSVAAITVSPDRQDPTFGPFGEIAGFVRSAGCLEGKVLETGLRLILAHSGEFVLPPAGFSLPVIEAARAAVGRNEKEALKSIRFDPKVYATEHYTPDIVAVRRTSGIAYLLELKRTTLTYPRPILQKLEDKMLAAALVTRDALLFERQSTNIAGVELAIIDCSGKDPRDCVITHMGLDQLLDYEGVGESLSFLRTRFAHHLQGALAELVDHERATGDGCATPISDAVPIPTSRGPVTTSSLDLPISISFARRADLARARA